MSSSTSTSTSAGSSDPTYPQVCVQLSGTDGNSFMVIGRVASVLRREVGNDAADAFNTAAYNCGSGDEVLRLAMATVVVS